MKRILEMWWTWAAVIAAVLLGVIAAADCVTLGPTGLKTLRYMGRGADDSVVLRGTVVNSEDGKPIRAALVQLMGDKPRAVLTGADGGFEFDGLAVGEAVIVARKPGYFSAQEYYPESVGEQRVHLAANLQPLRLKLYPEAVVYGKVTNENGRPLEGFTVRLMRSAGTNGSSRRRAETPSAITNENGEYRLAELHAGAYLVSVSRKTDPDGPVSLFQAVKLRSGYPTYFYPNVTEPTLATPVRLTPGKRFQAHLRLASKALCRITGNVQGASGDGPILVILVGQHDETPVAANAIMPGLTSFTLEGVPSGSYFVGAIQISSGGTIEEKTGTSVSSKSQETSMRSRSCFRRRNTCRCDSDTNTISPLEILRRV